MPESLGGLTAIVTGGGTGIGAATCEQLGREGVQLVVVGRRVAVVEASADAVRRAGGDAIAIQADVRVWADMERVVSETIHRYGKVDVLVANAAVVDHTTIAAADPAEWQDLINTNVLGVMFSTRAVLPHMLARRDGHIVIVSSVSGRVTYVGEPAYVSSKHATVAFADCLRQEVSPRGIRVTVVEPGLVDTPLIHANLDAVAKVVPNTVRPLDSADCARAITFALKQPQHCSINEIVLRPTTQLV
jgi:NADP-dependent 3-hydroxy acid dehydrogenase YdfG